jgi:hypothetical protein
MRLGIAAQANAGVKQSGDGHEMVLKADTSPPGISQRSEFSSERKNHFGIFFQILLAGRELRFIVAT